MGKKKNREVDAGYAVIVLKRARWREGDVVEQLRKVETRAKERMEMSSAEGYLDYDIERGVWRTAKTMRKLAQAAQPDQGLRTAPGSLGTPIIPGLRAIFAPLPGVVIQERPDRPLKRILEVLPGRKVQVETVGTGRKSVIHFETLRRYTVRRDEGEPA